MRNSVELMNYSLLDYLNDRTYLKDYSNGVAWLLWIGFLAILAALTPGFVGEILVSTTIGAFVLDYFRVSRMKKR